MSPTDITALRAKTCQVHAELGAMLLALEEAESFLAPEGLAELAAEGRHLAVAGCKACAHERLDTAAGSAEAAAAHLDELARDIDRHMQSLAPQGLEPADRVTIPPDEFSRT